MDKKLAQAWKMVIVAVSFLTFPFNGNAQITYSEKGLSIQGAPQHKYLGLTIDKYLGMYWTCKTSNFFQLDISPANPRLAGTGNEIVFYNSATNTFNDIQVANVYNYSDARAKENVCSLNSGLETILKLRPVTYTWKDENSKADTVSTRSIELAYGPKEDQMTQYGFLAQEVEEVFPDAVKTDEEGHKLINYTAIIPVLVQSIQELQGVIDEQATTIASLNSRIVESDLPISESRNKIISCSPNPTNSNITFKYKLDKFANDAYILISDLTGNQEMRITGLLGKEEVSANVSGLKTGLHIATLITGNSVQDSKQIVVTR